MIKNLKYLLLRRTTQILLLVLYFGANAYGWHILEGTFGSSVLFGTIPLADPYTTLQVLATGLVLGTDVLFGAVIITLFYFIIGGRAFCSWVCPINMVTDLSNWFRRVLKLDKEEVNYRFIKRSARYWIMALGLIVSAVVGVAAFEALSPITIMQRGIIFGFGVGVSVVVAIFLFDLFGVKNGWCGYLCPLGAAYSLIGSKSLIRVEHNHELCTTCMECKVVCPENQVLWMVDKESTSVIDGECTNCGRCIDVCNDDALGFGIRNFTKKVNSKKE
ncbi:MAG: quinol dehydrogenase ferredoxin subunit NapH [Sulfurovum sp.]|nr:quinol dehydrogenase ferredoxin subunit NapH [Sulfurovum sp.]MCB4749692.1 quinol dehydrogenase ferredoxin subunit NapH [Sulfurovum sp.]MCB4751879.1 quinol dehydrogenase ferredoxin subunit NapH [Sulfurovum sp.]MCB4755111.1 quinol dehydrogenase ferredoxin subunit NapH [Sulfurovum sp.]MCB4758387.1 quinol dehydrogenase ferredoxin subunit NapH [Sulfurovum sp.]